MHSGTAWHEALNLIPSRQREVRHKLGVRDSWPPFSQVDTWMLLLDGEEATVLSKTKYNTFGQENSLVSYFYWHHCFLSRRSFSSSVQLLCSSCHHSKVTDRSPSQEWMTVFGVHILMTGVHRLTQGSSNVCKYTEGASTSFVVWTSLL